MIPAGVEIFMATEPVDMRCGFNRLSGIALEHLGQDPRSGALFVFYGKRRHALKILFFDGTGVCLFYKRLDKGRFRIPALQHPEATHIELEESALEALLDAVEVVESKRKKPTVH
jgi:transposase